MVVDKFDAVTRIQGLLRALPPCYTRRVTSKHYYILVLTLIHDDYHGQINTNGPQMAL